MSEPGFEVASIDGAGGQSDGLNRYAIVHNNPVTGIDYLGLFGDVMPWQFFFRRFCEKPCSEIEGAGVVAELKAKGYDKQYGDTAQNAFRHCLATCRSAKKCGLSNARQFWDGRENDGKTPANRMDLANNQVGYANSSKSDCWDACQESWKNKEFTCLDKDGNLVPCPPPVNGK